MKATSRWCACSCRKRSAVKVLDEAGHVSELPRIHDAGLFAGPVEARDPHYRLRARFGDNEVELEDAYRFPPILSDLDLHLLGEGTHLELYNKLGAHPMRHDGVDGVAFVVFAPNARRVSVVGDFNFWDGRRHAMRVRGNGYWEIFVPARAPATNTNTRSSARTASCCRSRPIRWRSRPSSGPRPRRSWSMPRACRGPRASSTTPMRSRAPMSIYEVHLGSWRRKPERRRPLAHLSRAGGTASGLCRRHGLHPHRADAGVGASVRRLVGLSADRAVRADQPLRHAGRFRRADRRLPSQGPRRAARLGAGAFPRRSARARHTSTAPRSTSTPTRCRAAISTGAR